MWTSQVYGHHDKMACTKTHVFTGLSPIFTRIMFSIKHFLKIIQNIKKKHKNKLGFNQSV